MTLKSATRRTAALTVAAGCAFALSACSAGQISQTANQVAAVDGSDASYDNGVVTLRDVIVHPDGDGSHGSVKFTAGNQDVSGTDHTLESITVDGKPVSLKGDAVISQNCTLVGDSADRIKDMGGTVSATSTSTSVSASATPEPESSSAAPCTSYVVTTFTEDPTPGTTMDVTFTFDTGTIEMVAPVALPTPPAGEVYRQIDGIEEQGDPGKAASSDHHGHEGHEGHEGHGDSKHADKH